MSNRSACLLLSRRVSPTSVAGGADRPLASPCLRHLLQGGPFSLKRARVERAPPVMCKYDCSRVPRSGST